MTRLLKAQPYGELFGGGAEEVAEVLGGDAVDGGDGELFAKEFRIVSSKDRLPLGEQ